MSTKEEFWRLCEDVVQIQREGGDNRCIEPKLLLLLELVKSKPADRAAFVEAFITILQNPRRWPTIIVQYCMRELRFKEVYDKATEIDNASKPLHDSDAWSVLRAYGDSWAPGYAFEYYKCKEPPIKPIRIRYGRAKYFLFRTRGMLRRFLFGPRE